MKTSRRRMGSAARCRGVGDGSGALAGLLFGGLVVRLVVGVETEEFAAAAFLDLGVPFVVNLGGPDTSHIQF